MKKFIGTLIGITILLPFFINWLFGYIIPLLPGTMFVGTNETWVIFIGGFLGASLTLIGVYWQLEKTKEHRNKELISNTDAVYKLLKSELETILTKLVGGMAMLKLLKKEMRNLKKEPDEEIKEKIKKEEIKFIEEIKSNLGFIYPLSLKKDIIYSFINNSLPEQKMILIESTNKLLLITEEIEKLNYMNGTESGINFDIVIKSYNHPIEFLTKELKELKSNQLNFEKTKKKL